MRVFVPFPDDFNELPDLSRVKLVPYRPGLSLAPDPTPPGADAGIASDALPTLPPRAQAA